MSKLAVKTLFVILLTIIGLMTFLYFTGYDIRTVKSSLQNPSPADTKQVKVKNYNKTTPPAVNNIAKDDLNEIKSYLKKQTDYLRVISQQNKKILDSISSEDKTKEQLKQDFNGNSPEYKKIQPSEEKLPIEKFEQFKQEQTDRMNELQDDFEDFKNSGNNM